VHVYVALAEENVNRSHLYMTENKMGAYYCPTEDVN
jgi:hypothetical protein